MSGNHGFKWGGSHCPPTKDPLNGVVDGTSGDDLIDLTYTGDPEGDMIDNGDAIQPGFDPDADIVDAGAGDDTILAGDADDTIYAGSGSDVVYGEDGDDVIYGDSNLASTGRASFEWDKAPDPHNGGQIDNADSLNGGFTQDTGSVTVEFSVFGQSAAARTFFSEITQGTDDIDAGGETVDSISSMRSELVHKGESASYQLDFSDAVENVSFRVNDIDYDSVVSIKAYDANGNQIEVTLTGGANLTMLDTDSVTGDDTAVSHGGNATDTNLDFSVLVDIEGPVARIVIEHSQDGYSQSGIAITDIYFDDDALIDGGVPGDDTLYGGDGDDIIYGEGGDDSLVGGEGDDTLVGGDGENTLDGGAGDDLLNGGDNNDTITGGDGSDTVHGGDGDDIIDTSGGDPLPDLGFPGYMGVIPVIPADSDIYDDRDVVYGGGGDDVITTGDDADWIDGGTGNDTIDGGIDQDTIDGGDGDDFIVGGEGSDEISGGAGDDLIYGGLDPSFPDALNIVDDGTAGDPDPLPNNGMDTIYGGDGNDTIYGQDDDDSIDGGAGNDLLFGGIDEDTLSGGTGYDTLIGGQGADLIFGGDDADIIGGGIGDTIEGGEGGDDDDWLVVSGLATVAYNGETGADAEAGIVTFYNSDLTVKGTLEFSEIENVLVVGGSAEITSHSGGPSSDGPPHPGMGAVDGIVEGTNGDDLIDLTYTGDPEGDMVDNDDAVLPLINEQDVILAGNGDDTVYGMDDSDVIFGGNGDDDLYGNQGNDALDGGHGDDFLDGGEGRDIVVGGSGNDTLSGSNDIAGDGGDILYGQSGDDTFIKIGQGEVIDGGEDADGLDVDVLDLSGAAEAANAGGSLNVDYDPTNGENGTVTFFDASGNVTGTTSFVNIETVVCFTPGTLIATPKGERKIEDLKIGDRVITRDNGIQEIRWLGRKELTGANVEAARHLRPVLIKKGALGNNLPERDMLISPNHRVLVANDKTALYFEDREVLVAAKYLTGLEGVDVVDVSNVTYIHFMFDQHEVVLSDGAWTESFQPGDHSLAGIGNAQRNEIFELFPELENAEGLKAYQSARRSLKKHEAQLLTR